MRGIVAAVFSSLTRKTCSIKSFHLKMIGSSLRLIC